MICIVEGCKNARYNRGLCLAHYKRWKRSGSPEPLPAERRNKADIQRMREALEWIMDGEALTTAAERELFDPSFAELEASKPAA